MLSSGALSTLYDEAKVIELENTIELTGKDKKFLEAYQKNKPIYDSILETLNRNISDTKYMNPEKFMMALNKVLDGIISDTKEAKKIAEKISYGFSIMDKKAEIQKDKNGIIYDKSTKDIEIVPYNIDIEEYMESEVLPHIPDAKWFFEEDLNKKNPVIKTGAEISFTKYFYKYKAPTSSEELEKKFTELEISINTRIKKLFGGL